MILSASIFVQPLLMAENEGIHNGLMLSGYIPCHHETLYTIISKTVYSIQKQSEHCGNHLIPWRNTKHVQAFNNKMCQQCQSPCHGNNMLQLWTICMWPGEVEQLRRRVSLCQCLGTQCLTGVRLCCSRLRGLLHRQHYQCGNSKQQLKGTRHKSNSFYPSLHV